MGIADSKIGDKTMKATKNETFTPVKIELILESKQEQSDLFNVLNHAKVLACVDSDFGTLREAIAGRNPDTTITGTYFRDFSLRLRDEFKK